jgi:prepilin-type processing-associated H-X9-DG protein
VVISIIAVLISLIAPAVQSARKAARNVECLNNLHNLGIAMANFATAHNATLPPIETADIRDYDSPPNGIDAADVNRRGYGWPTQLFQYVDRSDLYREFQGTYLVPAGITTPDPATGVAALQITTRPDLNTWIKLFTCPDDINNYRQSLGLSYAANAGYMTETAWGGDDPYGSSAVVQHKYRIDWNRDGSITSADFELARRTGVFWRQNFGNSVTLDDISGGDGLGQTLMLAENTQSGLFISRDVDFIGFGLTIAVDSNGAPTLADNGDIGNSSVTPANTNQAFWFGPTFRLSSPTVASENANLGANPNAGQGTAPRPNSNHSGNINVLFCDGSAKGLNQTMNAGVYARLITWDGQRHGQVVVNESDFRN